MPKVKKYIPSEHAEQVALFQMMKLHEGKYPALKYAFAVPNGARTSIRTAVKLKAEGMRRGVPDVVVPIPIKKIFGNWAHGLFIEMKKKGNKPKPHQDDFIQFLRRADYESEVCFTAEEAMKCILDYLKTGCARYGE